MARISPPAWWLFFAPELDLRKIQFVGSPAPGFSSGTRLLAPILPRSFGKDASFFVDLS